MTSPISPNSSYYDPTAQFTPVDGPRPGDPVCSAASSSPASPPVVTIPPTVITGDAGAQRLVEQHDAAQGRDCFLEAANAALSCGKAGLTAAGTVATSSTVVGTALGLAKTVLDSVTCGKDLVAYYDCETQ